MGQVVAFDTLSPIPVRRLPNALNAILPGSIRVTGAEEMAEDFHPRHQAMRKLYSYRILNRQVPSPFIERYAWRVGAPLSDSDMSEGARHLTGTHDFAAFRAAGSSAESSVRTVDQLDVRRDGDLVEIWIGGSGFLYMMVRIIVGTLVEVGLGRRGPEDAERILLTRDRTQAGRTAPARGLCLVRVDY
jgi:tRNA pseudouridine38-40 synthase